MTIGRLRDAAVRVNTSLEHEEAVRQKYKMRAYFPDTGPFRRELYPKHIACMDGGRVHRERLFMAANRVGKTDMASYEISAHCTGLYPPWWTGKVFRTPIKVWIAGDTSKTVRDILQPKMVGEREALGTGMLPGYTLRHISYKANGAGMIDTVWVRHSTGGTSQIQFKSYAEGRESFQGTEQHVVWLDEEPPQEIYTECLLRTMTVNGIVLLTFTPLNGVTNLVLDFLKTSQTPAGAPPEPTGFASQLRQQEKL